MTSESGPLGFERILEALNQRKVRYVVIGGMAAILQGAPLTRTLDVDVTPAADPLNKRRLASALNDVGARLRAHGLEEPLEVALDERTFTGMITMTFVTRFGPLDLCFVPDGTTGYDDLIRDARAVEIDGMKILVASIADIVRSKKSAGREKDAAHLEILSDFQEGED